MCKSKLAFFQNCIVLLMHNSGLSYCPELYTIVIQALKKNGTCGDLEEQTNALEATFHSTLMFSL